MSLRNFSTKLTFMSEVSFHVVINIWDPFEANFALIFGAVYQHVISKYLSESSFVIADVTSKHNLLQMTLLDMIFEQIFQHERLWAQITKKRFVPVLFTKVIQT